MSKLPFSNSEAAIPVFLDVPRLFVRPRNTDWRYVRYNLPRLGEFCSSIRPILPSSLLYGLDESLMYVSASIQHKLFPKTKRANSLSCRVPWDAVEKSDASLVFSHRRFPRNLKTIPVVWQNSILDPNMQRSYGVPAGALSEEMRRKQPLFERSAVVQVVTNAEASRLGAWMPDIRNKFVATSFFLPNINAESEQAIVRKHDEDATVNVLFVGNEAYRKGLDLVLAAYLELPPELKKRTRFDIVSAMLGPKVSLPRINGIRFHGTKSYPVVLAMMRNAHIFVMPSRFESFGFAFLEAMSSGAAVIAPNWEPQREIIDDGRAGINVGVNCAAINDALEQLIVNRNLRKQISIAALNRFQQRYAPEAAAQQYVNLFRQALAA